MKFTNSKAAQIDFTKEVPFITFPVLSAFPFLLHGFSTKLGGVSSGMFTSMNFGTDSIPWQDEPANILENYRRIANSMGVDVNSLILSKQVHKTNVRLVTEADRGKGIFTPAEYEEIDGLITDRPDITLVTKYADCVPLFFVDPKNKAIGLSHSGWRGTVAMIGKVTVEEMQRSFNSKPEDIVAVIGPSICRDCFEIGKEVADEFRKAFSRNEDEILTDIGNQKYLCDLWAANRNVLLEAGITSDNIHICNVCTCCNSDFMFSHRKTAGKRGSLAAFLSLKGK